MPDAEPGIDWPTDARPTVRTAGLFALDARAFGFAYRSPLHALHLHEYAGTIRLDRQEFRLAPGTLTLSPAGGESSYDLPRPGVHWCVHFDPRRPRRSAPRVRLPLVRPLGALQGEAVQRFAQVARLHHSCHGPDAAAMAAAASVALQELLVWAGLLDRVGRSATAPRGDGIDCLHEFVDRHLHQPLRAAELAHAAGLSQPYLARLFRRRTGVTLPRYVLGRRIAAAKLLLATTDLPVKQIALRVGLPDPHHFNKQFRAAAGVSPSEFRKNG